MGHMRAPCSAASDRRWHDFLHGANAARAAGLRCLPSARLRRLALILLLAFGCAGGLALVEVALRLHQWAPDGVRSQFVEDRSLLHHRLRANFDGVVRGVHFTTNSRGLRDREFAVPKPAGIFRIAILGDSFTEGSGLEDAEAMPKRLEQRVQRACGLGIEVVNAGVSSYSPILYYLHLKYVVAPLQPDLVVVNVDMGDVHEDMIRTEIASLDAHGLPIAVPANRRLELAQTLPPILPPALRGLEALMARLAVYQRLRLSSLGIWFFGHRRLELAWLERSGLVGDLRYDPLAVMWPEVSARASSSSPIPMLTRSARPPRRPVAKQQEYPRSCSRRSGPSRSSRPSVRNTASRSSICCRCSASGRLSTVRSSDTTTSITPRKAQKSSPKGYSLACASTD